MADTLTANLRFELDRTNQTFGKWFENKEDWLESSETKYQQMMEECTCTMAALRDNEMQIEEAREYNNNIKEQQQADIERYEALAAKLRQQKKDLDRQIAGCEVEEERENQRYELSRSEHDKMQIKLEQSMNDLTQGVKLYLALGLEFQRTEGDCMKFIFTQIDPMAPSKQYFFTIYVDENDKYNLVDTSPRLDTAMCSRFVNNFNVDNNIGRFVVNMRTAFCRTLSM